MLVRYKLLLHTLEQYISLRLRPAKPGENSIMRPSLNPDDYTAFIDWKYYARVTVSANHVVEIDWKENSSLSKLHAPSAIEIKEDTTLETNL